jgi:hypothetical protein
MIWTSRFAAVCVSLGTILVAGIGAAHGQDAPPAPPPDPNAPPAQAQPAPGDYGAAPGYGPQPAPSYPPPPAYPPPAYAAPAYPPPPSPGYAPPGAYPPAYNVGSPGNVHDGFFLRLHLGGGFTSIKGNGNKISGGSVSLGVALGGALAENLILFGNFFLSVADSPDVTESGVTLTASGSATLGGFGAGLTYYFMPVNIYISGALAAMVFQTADADGNNLYSSDTGLGFQGMVGKEWWVSPEWGLGVAAELTVASMKDKNVSSISWTGSSFSLVFSSTFN